MSMEAGAFYIREGDRILPTGLNVSAWDTTKQGGGPIAGLVAQLLDGVPTPAPMLPTRLTIDFYGALPMAAMTARIRVLRDGRRIQITELELEAEGRTWVRASLLRVRTSGPGEAITPLTRPFPEGAATLRRTIAESVWLEGDGKTPGPGALWMRTITPIIADAPINTFASVATASDWGTTVSPPADPATHTYANLDISLHLSRMPLTDWMLLDGTSEAADNGVGITHLRLGDRFGMFGTAHQSAFIDKRPDGYHP